MDEIIDISSWQDAKTPDIDFVKVKESGVVGVMIKFTQGVNYLNPKAHTNFVKAHEAGLLVGAYHVGELGKNEAAAEAAFFLKHIQGLTITLAVALDVENIGSLVYPASGDWAQVWLAAVQHRAPYELIYCNKYIFGQLIGAPWGYKLWSAQFEPDNGVTAFMVQQPAHDVPGITGAVDYSVLTSLRAFNLGENAAGNSEPRTVMMPNLGHGDTGPAVAVLKTLLNDLGYDLVHNGSFDVATAEAVHSFQEAHTIGENDSVKVVSWAELVAQNVLGWRVTKPAPAQVEVDTPAGDTSAEASTEPAAEAAGEAAPTDPAAPHGALPAAQL